MGAKEMVMRRVLVVALALAVTSVFSVAGQQDKAADVLKEMRKALGGDKFESLKTLSLEGPFQRDAGMRQMTGTNALTMQLPDRMYRSEEIELPGGMSAERIFALAGTTAWEDQKQRGGMGGGMQIVMAGPGGRELSPEAIEEARLRRMRTEMMRYLMAFAGAASLQPTWVAVAEAPDGKADVLEAKNEGGATVRIFVDQQTHLPLMLQYTEVRPRMQMMGGPGRGGRGGFGGGDGAGRGGRGGEPGAGGPPPEGRGEPGQRPNPEEIRRRAEQMPPPAPSNVSMFLADYKKVDGVMIPHRLTQSVDGKPVEEWTIEKVKVNPSLKADFFDKK
jgi:hypothetical protein